MSRKVPRRRHVRRTKKGRTVVRRHYMTISPRKRVELLRQQYGSGRPIKLTKKDFSEKDGALNIRIKKGSKVPEYLKKANMSNIEKLRLAALADKFEFDIQEVDPDLTYEENITALRKKGLIPAFTDLSSKAWEEHLKTRDDVYDYAVMEYEDRSPHAIATDDRKRAKIIVTIDEIVLDPELASKESQRFIDIEGLDVPEKK